MFDNLSGLGYGIVTFAIIIGVGTVILVGFGDAIATCPTGFTYEATTNHTCQNDTLVSDTTNPTNPAWTNTNYLNTQLGQTGLAGLTPAIIAFSVGMLFLGAFFIKKGRRY